MRKATLISAAGLNNFTCNLVIDIFTIPEEDHHPNNSTCVDWRPIYSSKYEIPSNGHKHVEFCVCVCMYVCVCVHIYIYIYFLQIILLSLQ